MPAFNKVNAFVEDLCKAVHNFGTHTFKVALTNTAPTAATTNLASITQIANGNGYTTGGTAMTVTTAAQASGTFTFAGNKVTFTATGAALPTFRYAVLYNDTAASDQVVGYWDYGAGGVTLNDGESIDVKFSNADPGTVFTLV